ncbi:MAG TPA: 23S rRNA (uracil(1939)-C(5))-methyltransferase RlmD [Solirubrobacteraceae bacterium]|jgi:23S rRNA (uracil1939-C5)-methyltransferase|nr:23S rRNA (uracil(1939)-C(5))-methyltransferase RlmD [Solirubrobacteraceae bacterium]
MSATRIGAKLEANGLDAQVPVAGSSQVLLKRPERGEEIELRIDSLAHGGEGVGRLGEGGYVVFVSGALPGDRVKAVVVKRKRSYAHARMVEVLEESPERIPPTAKHPGVAWQVLPYERQLKIKRDQVEDALRRIGKLDGFELEEIVPALAQWRYRNKLEYSFGKDADGGLVCGFHAPAGWNAVEAIDDCLLASERGNRARGVALRWCREQGLLSWDRGGRPGGGRAREKGAGGDGDDRAPRPSREQRTGPAPDGRPFLRNLVVREGRHGGRLQIRLVTTDGELELGALATALVAELGEGTLSGLLWTRSSSLAETTMGGETELVWGDAELPERLGELDLRISSEAFFQTNTEMAELLYGIVVEYASLEGWERVYDLYSGIGTIALTLAPRAGELWGIEIVEQAVADAIAAAKRNDVTSAHFFAGDARLALPELIERAGKPDVVVLDPPRAGLSQKVVRRIVEASPKRIVYVSCNPTTLAPNAAQLVDAGWRLVKVRPVDMFPQTPHIECVALLERG